MLVFDESKVKRQLALLPKLNRIAFGAMTSERLLPNYEAFVAHHHWGDATMLREALDRVWASLAGDRDVSIEEIVDLRDVCYAVTPHSEDFDHDLVSPAIDAGCALVATLDAFFSPDGAGVEAAAISARDTVDMFIQARDSLVETMEDLEFRLAADPLMQRELHVQEATFSLLKAIDLPHPQRARELREWAAGHRVPTWT